MLWALGTYAFRAVMLTTISLNFCIMAKQKFCIIRIGHGILNPPSICQSRSICSEPRGRVGSNFSPLRLKQKPCPPPPPFLPQHTFSTYWPVPHNSLDIIEYATAIQLCNPRCIVQDKIPHLEVNVCFSFYYMVKKKKKTVYTYHVQYIAGFFV